MEKPNYRGFLTWGLLQRVIQVSLVLLLLCPASFAVIEQAPIVGGPDCANSVGLQSPGTPLSANQAALIQEQLLSEAIAAAAAVRKDFPEEGTGTAEQIEQSAIRHSGRLVRALKYFGQKTARVFRIPGAVLAPAIVVSIYGGSMIGAFFGGCYISEQMKFDSNTNALLVLILMKGAEKVSEMAGRPFEKYLVGEGGKLASWFWGLSRRRSPWNKVASAFSEVDEQIRLPLDELLTKITEYMSGIVAQLVQFEHSRQVDPHMERAAKTFLDFVALTYHHYRKLSLDNEHVRRRIQNSLHEQVKIPALFHRVVELLAEREMTGTSVSYRVIRKTPADFLDYVKLATVNWLTPDAVAGLTRADYIMMKILPPDAPTTEAVERIPNLDRMISSPEPAQPVDVDAVPPIIRARAERLPVVIESTPESVSVN